MVFLQSWVIFSSLLTKNTQSENSNPITIKPSLNSSSNKVILRILDETQINYNITNEQDDPSICVLSNDTFVIAWGINGQADHQNGVYYSLFIIENYYPSNFLFSGPDDGNGGNYNDNKESIPFGSLYSAIVL